MAKFVFRGKTWDEIKEMSLEEFSKLLTARERRSLSRGFSYEKEKLLKSIRKNPDKFHRTRCRDMIIIPELVGKKIGVHNGKEYILLEVKQEMLGHRLGEFVPTTRSVKHSAPGIGATRSSKFIAAK